jgi:hypothetical protein
MVNDTERDEPPVGEEPGADDLSGLERKGREAEEEGPVGPIEETLPARP